MKTASTPRAPGARVWSRPPSCMLRIAPHANSPLFLSLPSLLGPSCSSPHWQVLQSPLVEALRPPHHRQRGRLGRDAAARKQASGGSRGVGTRAGVGAGAGAGGCYSCLVLTLRSSLTRLPEWLSFLAVGSLSPVVPHVPTLMASPTTPSSETTLFMTPATSSSSTTSSSTSSRSNTVGGSSEASSPSAFTEGFATAWQIRCLREI
mmetsp:Transcript_5579/g.18852  ORF Transcript_5579/g.18852 Transcript_5579/m.18852 type:complete len:206 (+) Transcript_5579:981-1598(+)